MSQTLSRNTRLKIVVPLMYLCAVTALFVFMWPPQYTTIRQYIGVSVTYVAFVMWIIARIQLGNAFTIAPHAKFLVKTGLYSKLRHPVYYFSILAVMGISIFVWHFAMIIPLAALSILEWLRIIEEEKKLAQAFGQDYINYKKSTWF